MDRQRPWGGGRGPTSDTDPFDGLECSPQEAFGDAHGAGGDRASLAQAPWRPQLVLAPAGLGADETGHPRTAECPTRVESATALRLRPLTTGDGRRTQDAVGPLRRQPICSYSVLPDRASAAKPARSTTADRGRQAPRAGRVGFPARARASMCLAAGCGRHRTPRICSCGRPARELLTVPGGRTTPSRVGRLLLPRAAANELLLAVLIANRHRGSPMNFSAGALDASPKYARIPTTTHAWPKALR